MPAKPHSEGLEQYLHGVVEELLKQIPDATRHAQPQAVHRARVATRRLGAAIDITKPLLDASPRRNVEKTLKHVRKALGRLRDLDVMIGHLSDLHEQYPAAAQRMRHHLQSARDKLAQQLSSDQQVEEELAAGQGSTLTDALRCKPDRVRPLLQVAIGRQFADFARCADELCRGLSRKAQQRQQLRPHALRIAGKSLRYALEMAQAESLPVSQSTIRKYKGMQDALGLWHDHQVLALEVVAMVKRDLKDVTYRGDEEQLMLLSAASLHAGRQSLQKFVGLWRRHRDQITAGIEMVVRAAQEGACPR